MISVPRLSSANNADIKGEFFRENTIPLNANFAFQRDTTASKNAKQRQADEEKKKIKEVATAKKMPKPEKIEKEDPNKNKPKRQRRPDGLQRPPEIPRRND
ncbi:hypothetical protein [Mucilaginibacter sp.]|uniref:hypothetical protein n=1 Tax=Mucilaginibacter sp. TaxID=1882438 RepID=UPI0035BC5639